MFNKNNIPTIATIISSHLVSGSLAILTVNRVYKKSKQNQYFMTFMAISISLLQTFFIVSKIKRAK
jgi:hypothetical protein